MRIHVTTSRDEVSIAQAARFLSALSLLHAGVVLNPSTPADKGTLAERERLMGGLQHGLEAWRELDKAQRTNVATRPGVLFDVTDHYLAAYATSALGATGGGPQLVSLTTGSLDTVIENVVDSVVDFFKGLLPQLAVPDSVRQAPALVDVLLPPRGEDDMSRISGSLARRGAVQMAATLFDMRATGLSITDGA